MDALILPIAGIAFFSLCLSLVICLWRECSRNDASDAGAVSDNSVKDGEASEKSSSPTREGADPATGDAPPVQARTILRK